ncbi:hypothetical protein ACB094_03G000200 [Castanea mollissima]
MNFKASIRIIIISLLLFLFISSARVVAEPSNIFPRMIKKKSSWRAIIFQKKNSGPSDHEEAPSDGIGY